MAKLIQSVEFFVVGGPVQADRSCYVERRADQDVIDAIVDQRFAFVLASRGSGKSSLMLRTSSTLRADQQLTAVIDLQQIGAHGEGADASRWFYGIAHRVVRELRLKVDLQTWWKERSALDAEQQFADFFAEIVLENTTAPVTILIDEIEQIRELSFAADFFAFIRNCYALRVSEPDYGRLNFVVFGAATPAQLCPDASNSPFVIGEAIDLADFTLEECYRLEPGFGLGTEAALGLIERIYAWTNGQPYLTQKLARAVSRRGGHLEDVERSAQELFLSPNSLQEEPQLSHIRSLLTERGPAARPALLILRKLAKGNEIASDPTSSGQEKLLIAGVTRRTPADSLELKNRIYKQVFSEKWARSAMPYNWRGLGVAAGVAALFVLVPYWYFNFLPRPFVETLTAADVSYDDARDAYDRLHRLPGFASSADDYYADVLARRSSESTTLAELTATDAELRGLENRSEHADRLLAEYWLRRSVEAMNQEDRDAALLYATKALTGDEIAALSVIADLSGDDYSRLEATVHLAEPPALWISNSDDTAVSVIGAASTARTIMWRENAGPVASNSGVELTALQYVPFIRELSVDSEGSAGRFELKLVVDHRSATDLTVTLAAPSGASVTVPLNEELRSADGFVLSSSALDFLADERRQGVWRLTIVDAQAGNAGALHRWSLEFGDSVETWLGAPISGVAIPDPERTDEVTIDVSRDGRLAVARPALADVSGSLAIWDLQTGRLRHDLRLDLHPEHVEFSATGEDLLVVAGNELVIWKTATGLPTTRIQTQTQFLLPPAVSLEGAYVAIAERVDAAASLFSLIRVADGALVASIDGVDQVTAWVLGPEARYLALLNPSREIDIVDPRRGAIIAEFELDRPPARIVPVAGDDALVSVDVSGDVRVWRFAAMPDGLELQDNWFMGNTANPASLKVAASAPTLAFVARADGVVVHDLTRQRESLIFRVGETGAGISLQLSADGDALLTGSGTTFRYWSLTARKLVSSPSLDLSAMSIGAQGRFAALGFRDGFIRAESLTLLDAEAEFAAAQGIDFIGHRGPVTAVALNIEQNLVASGGSDGNARLWNLATLSPADVVLRHAEGPIDKVALSLDGRWLLTAAASEASLWQIPEGERVVAYSVNERATSVGFARDSETFAVGDVAGNIFVAKIGAAEPALAVRADSAITSLVFEPSGHYVASGDALGNVRFWPLTEQSDVPAPLTFRQAVRWMSFDSSGRQLYVQTEQWLHNISLGENIAIEQTRLLPAGLAPGAAATGEASWRLIGGLDVGRVAVADVRFEPGAAPTADAIAAGRLNRNWSTVLGLNLDADGNAVPVIR